MNRPCEHLICAVRWARSGLPTEEFKCSITVPMILDLTRIQGCLKDLTDETLNDLERELHRELNARQWKKEHT